MEFTQSLVASLKKKKSHMLWNRIMTDFVALHFSSLSGCYRVPNKYNTPRVHFYFLISLLSNHGSNTKMETLPSTMLNSLAPDVAGVVVAVASIWKPYYCLREIRSSCSLSLRYSAHYEVLHV